MARIEVTEEPDTGKKGPDPAAAPRVDRAAALRAELDDVLGELADEARECDPDDGWYPDTADLEDLHRAPLLPVRADTARSTW